jgi:1-acyl-sn-glycerol-3-phosphate acyltransferase
MNDLTRSAPAEARAPGATATATATVTSRDTLMPRGSALARGVLALFGWRVDFAGLPGQQGVIAVYPHTSNWDFPVGLLAKWTMGLDVKFWGKDSLFRVPVFGAWMRWVGGVAVNRSSANGMVGHTVAEMQAARTAGRPFWLVVAPEGTRSLRPGWRSGFYRVAHGAQVPVLIAAIDFGSKTVRVRDSLHLSGDAERDMAEIARLIGPARGLRGEMASPINLL